MNKPDEVSTYHYDRVIRILSDLGAGDADVTSALFLAAYNAVLARDSLWIDNEMLMYKQNEVHR